MGSLRGFWALMAICVPLVVAATPVSAAVAVPTHKHDQSLPAAMGGPVIGATGYVFVDGVGWRGAEMIYCPPSIGHILPERIRYYSKNEVVEGRCGDQSTVSAQEYINLLLGDGEAEVIAVAPAVGRYSAFGIIYYRSITK